MNDVKRSCPRTLALMAALAVGVAPMAHAAEDVMPVLSDVIARDTLENDALIESERSRNSALVSVLTASDATGIRRQYRNRTVSDTTYADVVDALGERGVIDAVGIIGYYTLLAMVMNTAHTPLPAGAEPGLVPLP